MEILWIRHDKLTSTNLYLKELLKQKKLEEGVVVIADYQEAGRGQGDNSWHSRAGENLLMSILLIPAFLSASQQFQLSRLISVALCEHLLSLGIKSMIKWPNDILVKGGKIAGMLIEHGISGQNISHTIAGIGLNLNQKTFPEFLQPASSVILETGLTFLPGQVAEKLMFRISRWYEDLREGKHKELENKYVESLFRLGSPSRFDAEGDTFEGIIRGVSPYGELLVERQGHLQTFAHNQIKMKEAYRVG